jgi:type II secretory ATPase GspE/PulE/Tfp pilus assembly ATPase PilB-like protein
VTDYQKKFIEQAITHLKTPLLTAVPSTIITESTNTDPYQGRLMVAEVLRIDDTIRQMIVENATLHTIQEYVLQS